MKRIRYYTTHRDTGTRIFQYKGWISVQKGIIDTLGLENWCRSGNALLFNDKEYNCTNYSTLYGDLLGYLRGRN